MSSNADRQRSSIANRAVTLPKLRTQFSSYSDPSWKSLWRRIAIAFFAIARRPRASAISGLARSWSVS